MTAAGRHALARGRRWLSRLAIPEGDVENQILLIFGLAVTSADSHTLKELGKKAGGFVWFQYEGDPLPAICANRTLVANGIVHDSLSKLEREYRTVLQSSDPRGMELLYDLLSIPFTHTPRFSIPSLPLLATATRKQILELCRLATMTLSCGIRQVEPPRDAAVLPQLAVSYARDWDLEVSSALLRACTYMGLAGCAACTWVFEWLLDQQQADGSIGLLRAEARKRGKNPEDWRTYFQSTLHALWAIADTVGANPALIRLLTSKILKTSTGGNERARLTTKARRSRATSCDSRSSI